MNHLRIAIILLFAFSTSTIIAQSCCDDPNKKFADLADAPSFRGDHELPRDVNFKPNKGHMITFDCPEGAPSNAYLVPAKVESSNWLIVIHEWWGLNDNIKAEAEKLWKDLVNVNVLALDMYDGNVATTREEASQYMQGMSKERAFSIISGMNNYVGKDAQICTIGWCFGGGWSLQTAIEAGDRTVGCVMYYGMPDEDITRLKNLKADVLGIFASKDEWINPEVVAQFEMNMNAANVGLQVHSYDADHAFANPSSPRYDEAAAQEAYGITLAYLVEKFK
jgi:carboxymethylenebutenolidase